MSGDCFLMHSVRSALQEHDRISEFCKKKYLLKLCGIKHLGPRSLLGRELPLPQFQKGESRALVPKGQLRNVPATCLLCF